jgi:type I site-specific restriction-modification system R (restriction) subunit
MDGERREVFDSVIVITDRRILDDQIQKTIKQFMQVGATVGHAEHSGDLRRFIEQGKKIIVTTVQKFPFILDEIGAEQAGKTLRHRHRRGAFEPGRQDLGGDEQGAGGGRMRRGDDEDADPKTW